MHAETKRIADREFWLVGQLQLRRTADGNLDQYVHNLDENIRPNRYAEGPFCYMGLPGAPSAAGVYAIFVDNKLKYIGECENLANRFGPSGYGKIHPRNCHHDGQSTNCKLNSFVLTVAKQGQLVLVWFLPSSDRKSIESELIRDLSPPWNKQNRKRNDARSRHYSRAKSTTPQKGPTKAEFQKELQKLLIDAKLEGVESVYVRAGDLHKRTGGYPGINHRMPSCCDAMRFMMHSSDRIIQTPPKGYGANLVIEYQTKNRLSE